MKNLENLKISTEMVYIPCPLCGEKECEPVYVRYHETGSFLGRIKIENVLCHSCHLMYMNPRPTQEAMFRYYAQMIASSGNTAYSTETDSRYSNIIEERTDFISTVVRRHLDIDHGNVLDVGCSQGFLLNSLQLPGWQMTGLEPSTEAASIARERGLDVIEGFIEKTTLQSETYDVVLCMATLEHVYDLKSTMENLARSMKTGGLLFIEVPNSLTPLPQIAEFYSFEHLSHFTSSTLNRLLNYYGFEVRGYDPNPGIPCFRVVATKIGREPIVVEELFDERDSLTKAINDYKKLRNKLEDNLIARFESLVNKWKKNNCRVAIYGAGIHTHFLLNLINFDDQVEYIFDSDKRKQGVRFLHWMVYGPEDIERLNPSVIIISSKPYQEEIYRQIAHYQTSLGTEIIKCYE
jgi:2-polyprenyl-3-methyl-5-hydroxy-6-metoxy-1,4-benzoquinol methylase